MKNIFTIILFSNTDIVENPDWYELDGTRTSRYSGYLTINTIVGDIDKAAKALGGLSFRGEKGTSKC